VAATIDLIENYRVVATDKDTGLVFKVDIPDGEFPTAANYLAAAVGCCMTETTAIKAKQMGISFDGARVQVEKTIQETPHLMIGSVDITFNFPDTVKTDDKQRIILERTARTCPNARSLSPDVKLTVVFNWPGQAATSAA
jgi:putative redox protein